MRTIIFLFILLLTSACGKGEGQLSSGSGTVGGGGSGGKNRITSNLYEMIDPQRERLFICGTTALTIPSTEFSETLRQFLILFLEKNIEKLTYENINNAYDCLSKELHV